MPQRTKYFTNFLILLQGIFLLSFFSCTVVRNYPKDRPFIFENTLILQSISKEKKSDIKAALEEQIEDSAKVYEASRIPWPKAPWLIPVPVIDKPVLYDSISVMQSAANMRNLMVSKGYRSASIQVDSSISIKKDQKRIRIKYTINAGPVYRIDSFNYKLADSNLFSILQGEQKAALLKKGEPFDYNLIDQELGRMVNLFRSKGYYNITREDFFVEADSGFAELIDPSMDPFEYISKLAELQQRKKNNPQVDIFIRQYPPKDTNRVKPYTVGEFTIYADMPINLSDIPKDSTIILLDRYKIISYFNTFKPSFISRFIALKPGHSYSQDDFSRTLNNLNKLGVWQNINITPTPVDSLQKINYDLRLTPAKKQFFTADIEGSSVLNSSQLVLVGSGRVGLALNLRLRNRNIGKRGIQLENSFRTGIEFNNFSKILSSEFTIGNRLSIPWLMTPFGRSFANRFVNARTIITGDISFIDRFQYYNLRSISSFIGYEWKPRTNTTWQFKPLNIELTQIRQDSLFKDAIIRNPLLVYAYNNGLIIGNNVSYNLSFNGANQKHVHSLRIYGEESGILFGNVFPNLTAKGKSLQDLYKFLKMDIDYRYSLNWKNSSFALRGFLGVGKAFNTQSRQGKITLPFFKSYFAGGPNSMRGWQIRKLGIGSNIFFDTLANGVFNDKYADIRLEANLEYRFNVVRFFGYWLRGAVFTDMGNIWFRNNIDGQLPGSAFQFNNLYKDLAIASGAGLRLDFNYFLLRFDWGLPIKDPRYGADKINTPFYSKNKNGWFVDGVWNRPSFQFAIGYPF